MQISQSILFTEADKNAAFYIGQTRYRFEGSQLSALDTLSKQNCLVIASIITLSFIYITELNVCTSYVSRQLQSMGIRDDVCCLMYSITEC